MTDKKENILNAALELFAKEGFNGTSTNKIAKTAGVSEGLIFRHFKNKEGLLAAILLAGEEKVKTLFADIIFESDPKIVINKTLDLMTESIANQYDADFWKLQYKIKWEVELYSEHKMEPLQLALTAAFNKLAYENPDKEANLLLVLIDGMATRYFLQKNFDLVAHIEFLKKKYEQ